MGGVLGGRCAGGRGGGGKQWRVGRFLGYLGLKFGRFSIFVGRLGNLKTLAGLSCSVDLYFCQWFFKKNNLLQKLGCIRCILTFG